jgi:type VI secretion system protein
MALKLRVISDHYQELGKQSSQMFGVTGGRIGRSADNDWVLPDPERYISSHHAAVRYEAGRWLLEDTSTNGIFVNGGDIPQSQLGPCQLHDGDRLRMGDYDILVSIDENNDFPADSSGQTPKPRSGDRGKAKPVSKSAQRAELEELNVELDINQLLSGGVDDDYIEEQRDQLEVGSAYGLDVPRAVGTAPRIAAASTKVEDIKPMLSSAAGIDWHLRTRRIDPPNQPARASFDGNNELNAGLEAFCKGAGVDPNSIGTESKASLLTMAGQMLREVALGVMEVNKARGDIKSRDSTGPMLAATDNNPLKVASSVDDAMRKLLDPQNSRYLPPVEAIRDSFADLRNHQQSLIAAMHSALNSTMSRLDPAQLQDRFDRSLNRGGLMSAANKLKYWDMYAEFYQVINQRNNDGLPISYADEFAQTYTERMAGFRKARRR